MTGFASGGIVAPPAEDGGDSVLVFLGCDYVFPVAVSRAYLEAVAGQPRPGELSPGTDNGKAGDAVGHDDLQGGGRPDG